MQRTSNVRRPRGAARAIAAVGTVSLLGSLLTTGACGDEIVGCPSVTEPLRDEEVDLYRQLEVCASRVVGMTLYRVDLPLVEKDPELVDCDRNPLGKCVTTPAGQPVTGYYLPNCDTFSVVVREVLYHEMLHPILSDVPGLEGDPGHESPVWTACQTISLCPDGRLLLEERVCDGTPDCAKGEDEVNCG